MYLDAFFILRSGWLDLMQGEDGLHDHGRAASAAAQFG
jgi:hypothetical protein